MIHMLKGDYLPGKFTISTHGYGWRCGVYESSRAANYAFRFSDRALYEIQQSKNQNENASDRVISFHDLQEYRKRNPVMWNK